MISSAPARILIVDDEEAQMRALCDTLSDHDYVTVGFNNGKAAIEELRMNTFDLLLADLMMPEMDGIALLRSAIEIEPDLVGIIMTGEGTIATAVDAMKSGALDYVLKPFKLSAILPVLSRALAVRRLRKENAELHQSVLERTQELELANRELESFSFSVSHDLRAPLRAINSYSKIIIEDYGGLLPEEGKRFLDYVVTNARRMGTLIDDILRFSQAGRHSLKKDTIEIAKIVEHSLEQVRKTHTGKEVQVIRGSLPSAYGDAAMLEQVYTNLLSNAFKFTQECERPMVEVGSFLQNGETIFFVKDNGAGFDMAYADKLFTAFSRLHSMEQFEGTGVGLSIVHRIIHRHGGRIWADAKVDGGATFYFTLAPAE